MMDFLVGLQVEKEGDGPDRWSKTGERKQRAHRGEGFSWLARRSARVKLNRRKKEMKSVKNARSGRTIFILAKGPGMASQI